MAENDEDVWRKLSSFDKVCHKNWKARKAGYEELLKEIPTYALEPEKAKKYCPLLKGFVTEQNELSRMVSTEVAKLVLDYATTKDAAKHVSAVCDGAITKCFSSKPKTKENAIECCLLLIEHEKADDVCSNLLTGTQNKNPKISISCIQALTAALAAFGSKVVKLKDCLAEMPKLFQHRDKNVRNSAKDFFVEAYCWIGAPVKHALERVPKIEQSIKECEDVWKELKSKSKQKRFFKSQQAEREAAAVESDGEDDDDDDEEEEVEVDVLEFAQEVNFLAELGKARFGEDKIDAGAAMASKKWKERGEALDKMALILMMEKDSPIKLSSGDYMSVMTDIKTLIKKDTNVLLIVKAFKIVKRMAEAMRENFKNFGPLIMQEILARFKEKKVTVLEAAREAADAVAKTIKFPDAIIERVIECLEDKNPGVRSETMLFMYRCSKSKKVIFPKSFVKEFLTKVTKNIEHSDKNVRDEAYKMLAVMSTKLDLKIINTFISDFKEDRMKLYQAAVEELKGAPKDNAEKISKANEPPAPEKKTVQKEVPKKTGVKSKKPTKKPAASKKEEITESSGPPAEADIDEDTAIDTCNSLFGEEAVKKVQEKNWKTRLEGLQEVTNKLNSFEAHEIKTQPIYKVLSLAPGFKDTNFQCNQEKFKIIRTAAQNPKLSQTSINIVFNYCLDKISDVKCGALAKEALFGMADIVSLAYMAERVLSAGNKLKSVKNIAECWSWFAEGLPQFGFGKLDIKMLIDQSNIALAHSNAGIRTKAIEAIANVLRYVAPLRGKYDDQKDAIKTQIDDHLKTFDGPPPPPTRGPVLQKALKVGSGGDDGEAENADADDDDQDDLIPRSDVSAQLTSALLEKMEDKNWKMRKEALDETKAIFEKNKYITDSLGDLPLSLSKRFTDVNKVLVQTSFDIAILIAAALGKKGATTRVKAFVVPLIAALNDSKVQIREKGAGALSAWHELVPLKFWFDDEAIAGTLGDAKKIHLRYTFLGWLADKLPDEKKIPKASIEACLPHLMACMEDRDGKVRDAAQKSLLGFMIHSSYPAMIKLAKSPKTKDELEKAKELLPKAPVRVVKAEVIDAGDIMSAATSKPKKSKKKAPVQEEVEDEPIVEDEEPKKKAVVKKKVPAKKKITGKKVEEEDFGDIITGTEKAKSQRIKEDSKLKLLKWHYDPGTACRKELVEQLNKQISENFGDKFAPLMHKTDSTALAKAISLLEPQPLEAIKPVLDIITRWMTIRMNEKNTTILTKVLSWLSDLTEKLKEDGYEMSAYESIAFLPHLISKLGESRQEIRSVVLATLVSLEDSCTDKRVFEYLLQGAKSKNSRQRTECLNQCAKIIAKSGVEVAGPPKQGALKEIAAHIADKDQNVRSGAMNCLVEVYRIIGESVYSAKVIGRLGDKEEAYLKERIKRAGPAASDQTVDMPPPQAPASKRKARSPTRRGTMNIDPAESALAKRNIHVQRAAPAEIINENARFRLELPPDAPTRVNRPRLNPIDYEDIADIPEVPARQSSQASNEDALAVLDHQFELFGMTEKQHENLVFSFASENKMILFDALNVFEKFCDVGNKNIPPARLEELILALCHAIQRATIPSLNNNNTKNVYDLVAQICVIFQKILRRKELLKLVSLSSYSNMIMTMFDVSCCKSLEKNNDFNLKPCLNQIILDINERGSYPKVVSAYLEVLAINLQGDAKKLQKICRCFLKFFRNPEANPADGDVLVLVIRALSKFYKKFPKSNSVYQNKSAFETYRLLNLFAAQLAKKNASHIRLRLEQLRGELYVPLHDLLRQETSKVSAFDNKENQPTPLFTQASRITAQIKTEKTHDVGMVALTEFVNMNPSWDIKKFLKSENKGLQKYINTRLAHGEILKTNTEVKLESENFDERLEELRERFGLNQTDKDAIEPSSSELESFDKPQELLKTSPTRKPGMSPDRIAEFRKRLTNLKKSH